MEELSKEKDIKKFLLDYAAPVRCDGPHDGRETPPYSSQDIVEKRSTKDTAGGRSETLG